MSEWKKVVFADQCDSYDEDREFLICVECGDDYADCPCPGPTMSPDWVYKENKDGELWARPSEVLGE